MFQDQVRDGSFWFPTDLLYNPKMRLVASEEIISKMIKNLRRKPSNLFQNKKYWTQRIKDVSLHDDLLSVSHLIRDLSPQKTRKRLNDSQIRALSKFKERLLIEWAAITDGDFQEIRSQFNKHINESKAKINFE